MLKVNEVQELTGDQKQFLAQNVGRLDQKASEGVRDIVKHHIQPDENGNLDFDLELLPYQVSLSLYEFVKNQIDQEESREHKRQKKLKKHRKEHGRKLIKNSEREKSERPEANLIQQGVSLENQKEICHTTGQIPI